MSITTNVLIKCRQCRSILTKRASHTLLNAHNERYSNETDAASHCPTVYGRTEVYLGEEELESWIQEAVEKSEWTKGKLKCLKCQSNIGSFDFVTGQKCECRQFNQPSVHLIKSKIDIDATAESSAKSTK